MYGNNVSHAKNKTRRRFLPNLHRQRFYLPSEDRWVRLTLSARAIKTVSRKGIEAVIKDLRAKGEKV